MGKRGLFNFEIDDKGNLINNKQNLDLLRKMLLDRQIIDGDLLGPGDPGDFDKGAWHVICHLAGGCAVYKTNAGYMWAEISHIPNADIYTATLTVSSKNESVRTYPLLSEEGGMLIKNAALLGFVEGSSQGHISARDARDDEKRFNLWKRQDFDLDAGSENDGGRVWEHWCTVRNLDPSDEISNSVLKSYLSLVSLCGGKFSAIVARGRRDYSHPNQLLALVEYGFISKIDALTDIKPKPIPRNAQELIYSADPVQCLSAAAMLPWKENEISYFMFERRIARWSTTQDVEKDFQST